MTPSTRPTFCHALLVALFASCGGDDGSAGSAAAGDSSGDVGSTSAAVTTTGADSTSAASTGRVGTSTDSGGDESSGSTGEPPSELTCETFAAFVAAFKAAHDGNGGKDWDINAWTEAEIAADPQAQQLRALCGPDERPVIPQLAWEYGGGDHPWIAPEAAFAYVCVWVPVNPGTEHWMYDAVADHVTADVALGCPELNPCQAERGADQVMACLGDPTNVEILVDTASLGDGIEAGYDLSEASTDLYLRLDNGDRVFMYAGT